MLALTIDDARILGSFLRGFCETPEAAENNPRIAKISKRIEKQINKRNIDEAEKAAEANKQASDEEDEFHGEDPDLDEVEDYIQEARIK